MNYIEKISELKSIIAKEVSPLITSNYVLWGLPYYPNIGDTLIWEGELDFLKLIPYKCIGVCGWDEYQKVPLKEDTIILITGGGYMGDVWRKAWDNVMNTIELYPKNPIVILPNTIYYNDHNVMHSDAERMSKLKKLTICVRDKVSYQIAKENFKNDVRLVPDMAFHIPLKYLNQWRLPETNKILFLKRIDKELGAVEVNLKAENIDIRDWPTIDGKASMGERVFYKSKVISYKTKRNFTFLHSMTEWIEHRLGYYVYRKSMTKKGVQFVSAYKEIFTTRLHVMILSVLLGKKVYFIDNSYGKLSSFYSAWLEDCDDVESYTKQKDGNNDSRTDI